MSQRYEPNEKDIDKILNYLKIVRPDKATPDMAITVLKSMQISAHKASHGEIVNIDEAIERALKQIEGGE